VKLEEENKRQTKGAPDARDNKTESQSSLAH